MKINNLAWKIGGQAGQGILTIGKLFSKSCSRGGLNVVTAFQNPSLIRGGHNSFQVQVESGDLYCHHGHVDLLVALNAESITKHENEVLDGGIIVYDAAVKLESQKEGLIYLPVNFLELAQKAEGTKVMNNIVALGVSFGLVAYDSMLPLALIEEVFKRKGDSIITKNKEAFRLGYELGKQSHKAFGRRLDTKVSANKLLITGNQAIALGAIKAGCKFVSAYPMTPATSIMEEFVKYEDDYGLVMKQTEDEISAALMAIGSSFAGVRAMTATSGGGFCLMTEALGLAGSSETPLVIVNVQRPGPSTGLPTRVGQPDLRFMMHASQDEIPRFIVAPGTVEECFYDTIDAFNFAEKYQMPAIILSDKFVGSNVRSVEKFDQNKIKVERFNMIFEGKSEVDYKRFEFTKNGCSPRSFPGVEGYMFRTTGNEHDERGVITEDKDNRNKMMEKRMGKLKHLLKELDKPKLVGAKDAIITLVCWGSTINSVMEASKLLKLEGIKANVLQIKYFVPFHKEEISKILKNCKTVLALEANYSGQMCSVIREECGVDLAHQFLKYDGREFVPFEIVAKVKEVLK
jgi:2-oxoglutarate/2-oxoacid ferredoxin oxidoreductase subunit alpha